MHVFLTMIHRKGLHNVVYFERRADNTPCIHWYKTGIKTWNSSLKMICSEAKTRLEVLVPRICFWCFILSVFRTDHLNLTKYLWDFIWKKREKNDTKILCFTVFSFPHIFGIAGFASKINVCMMLHQWWQCTPLTLFEHDAKYRCFHLYQFSIAHHTQ